MAPQFARRRMELEGAELQTFKLGVIWFCPHGLYYSHMRLAFCIAVGLSGGVSLGQPMSPEQEKQVREMLKAPVVYSVPGMDKVHVTEGLAYRTDDEVTLHMNVYRPAVLARESRRPAVFFLHGGVNLSGPSTLPKPIDWGVYQSYGRLLAASGLIGVTFNQRIGTSEEKGFGDVQAAMDYVRKHAADLQVDTDRFCLAAYSAGGPLLAIAIRDPQPAIRCLVGFYAVLDIKPPATGDRAQFSPIEQLKLNAAKLPPILIARAGQDSAGLNATIDRFVAEALSRDVPIELHNIKGAPHAFDILTPTPEVRGVIARTIAFMKQNLEK
jgi:acetyl esterase/lipase